MTETVSDLSHNQINKEFKLLFTYFASLTVTILVMVILVSLLVILLISLLTVFRAPTNHLWYLAILVTEFSWIFIILIGVLLFLSVSTPYTTVNTIVGLSAIGFFSLPNMQAWKLAKKLEKEFKAKFAGNDFVVQPFQLRPWLFLGGLVKRRVHCQRFVYDQTHKLALDFYSSQIEGTRPCVVVIHGGSWAAGDSMQLPELNWELAKAGYHVASINYRLAPYYHYPAPLEDVQKAIDFLRQKAADLFIDSKQVVLLGRSAGAQIALSAAYTLNEPCIKAVIDFYGPTDMVWGFENPTHPLVLDSRKIMADYLGGTLNDVRDQYIHSSATETVTTHTPPTLMIYAENDPLVSPRHGTRLSVKLKAMKIPHYELYLPWATHGFDYTLSGPGGQLSTWTVMAFLQALLKDEKGCKCDGDRKRRERGCNTFTQYCF